MKARSIILALTCILLMSCNEQQESLDIYLCIGQSNMAGRGLIDKTVSDTLAGVFVFVNDDEKVWEKAANPLNKYSTIRKKIEMQKLGPSYSFADEMRKLRSEKNIGLVVNAKGGTSIRQWHPDSLFFKEAVKRTKEAMLYGELKGIIWHQGCSDASRWEMYPDRLKEMLLTFRAELGDENLPFVAGQLSFDKEHRVDFNKMILNVPDEIDHTAVVRSKGLHTIDRTHFDTKSQVILGQRYAAEMFKLLGAE